MEIGEMSLEELGYPNYVLSSEGFLLNIKTDRVINIINARKVYLSDNPKSFEINPQSLMNWAFKSPRRVMLEDEYISLEKFNCSNYIACKNGTVYSLASNRYLKPKIRKYDDYDELVIVRDDKTRWSICAHRLIAQAFIPNPENKEQVNHIVPDKRDNSVTNLEWVHPWENLKHARDNGKRIKALSEAQIHCICGLLELGHSPTLIAKLMRIKRHNVCDIQQGLHHYIAKDYNFKKLKQHPKLTNRIHTQH